MTTDEMMRGLVRAAEMKEQDGGGTVWDDEVRLALDEARFRGWGRNNTDAVDRALTATGPVSGEPTLRSTLERAHRALELADEAMGDVDSTAWRYGEFRTEVLRVLAAPQTDHRAARDLVQTACGPVHRDNIGRATPPSGSPPACQCKDQKQAKCQCEPCGCKARNAASPPEYPDGSPRPPELPPRCPDCDRERCSCGGSRGTR